MSWLNKLPCLFGRHSERQPQYYGANVVLARDRCNGKPPYTMEYQCWWCRKTIAVKCNWPHCDYAFDGHKLYDGANSDDCNCTVCSFRKLMLRPGWVEFAPWQIQMWLTGPNSKELQRALETLVAEGKLDPKYNLLMQQLQLLQ